MSRGIVRHADHGDTFLNAYPGTRISGPKNPADFGSDTDPVTGTTRPGKPARYPGPTRTGGTPNLHLIRFLICSDELLNPHYGRPAIGAERPIIFSRFLNFESLESFHVRCS